MFKYPSVKLSELIANGEVNIRLSQEFLQDAMIRLKPQYGKIISDEEIAMWKEGEALLNSIDMKAARTRVKIEKDAI